MSCHPLATPIWNFWLVTWQSPGGKARRGEMARLGPQHYVWGSPKIDQSRLSGCPVKLTFLYTVAAKSSTSSPCSNVPLHCPICPKLALAVAKYNLKIHLLKAHPNVPVNNYESLWSLSNFKNAEMKNIWGKQQDVSVKQPKQSNIPPLVISEAHQWHIPDLYILPSTNCSWISSDFVST